MPITVDDPMLTTRQNKIFLLLIQNQPAGELDIAVEDLCEDYTPGLIVRRREGITFLRRLAELDMGRFVTGRRGRPTRLEWKIGRRPKTEPKTVLTVSHTFRLREGLKWTLPFPHDLTRREAERIADLVKSIPLED